MPERFVYANGRISAGETTFLDRRIWQMLLSARDGEEAIRFLGDTWYGSFMQHYSMEECFVRAMEAAEEELLELSADRSIVRGILYRRDVRNARYLWKAKLFLGEEAAVATERPGLVPVDVLGGAPEDPALREELPPAFRAALEDVSALEEGNTVGFDRRMDRLAAEVEIGELAPVDPEAGRYVKVRLEQKNFLAAGRCLVDDVPPDEVEKILFPGGYHSPGEISAAYRRGGTGLSELLGETTGFEAVTGVYDSALESGSFYELEREYDAMLLEMLEEGSFPVFGPLPLLSYVLRKELEVSHLKLLLAAKSAGVGRDILRARLPRG